MIDYALNDRGIGLERLPRGAVAMLGAARGALASPYPLPHTPPVTLPPTSRMQRDPLNLHAEQIRWQLAVENGVGLADSLAAAVRYVDAGAGN